MIDDEFPDDMDEVVPEDWPTFYTAVPVWLLLCGCSAQAYRMYAFLAEHINNRTPGQRIAFPSQRALARAMGLKDYRDVAQYRKELEALGAIRVEEFRYAGGMRRRYRYFVRFNPPQGYAGPVSLEQFYEANPDVRAKKTEPARIAAMGETAGQPRGGKKPTSEGGEKPRSRGGESPTAQQLDQEELHLEEPDAPSARSATDPRRGTAGSTRVREREGGSAASGKKRSRLTRPEYQAIGSVLELLPDAVREHLPAKTPPNVGAAILEALATGTPAERTAVQLVEHRVLKRWDGYWASKLFAGELRAGPTGRPSLVGPLLAMLKHQPECGDPSCEDRVNVHTGQACTSCGMRAEDKRAARRLAPQPASGGGPAGVETFTAPAYVPPPRADDQVSGAREAAETIRKAMRARGR